MVVTVAVVVPAADRVDKAGGVELTDALGDAALRSVGVLAPAFVVDDLGRDIRVSFFRIDRLVYLPRRR